MRVKTLTFTAPPGRQDRLASPHHMRRVDRVADKLEREIGLHAGRHVEAAADQHRPAAVRLLSTTQVVPRASLDHRIPLAEEVQDHDVFGGNCRIGLEVEHPMAIGMLQLEQRLRRPGDAALQPIGLVSGSAERRIGKEHRAATRFSKAEDAPARQGIVANARLLT